MYTRILVPVDGSSFSEQIVAPAAELARGTGATLTLLRVVDGADERAAATDYVKKLATPVGATALCLQAPGEGVAAAIRHEAKRVPATLVVMCSHGRSGAMQAIFGSVALQVLRELGEPLVVFHPHQDSLPAVPTIRQVVLPLDGSELSETIVPQAAELAKWLGAKVVVVSVLDPAARSALGAPPSDVHESTYVRARAREIADRYGVAIGWEVLHGDPKEAIPHYVRGLGDAMLAMTTHGRTGLRSVMAGSVTAQCLRDAKVPVFTRLP